MKTGTSVANDDEQELLPGQALPVGQPSCPKIIIAEDDDDLADLVQYRLRKEGFETIIARNGKEACYLLDEVEVDLVLLDILMPGMDGWEVCRRLRGHRDRRKASVPVIMLTALATDENRIKGLECGADAYLAKPYSIHEVVLNSRRLISERRERLRLQADLVALREKEQGVSEMQRMLFHEFRAQFSVIAWLCHRMLQCDDPLLLTKLAKERGYLELIRKSANQILEMADEALVLSGVPGGSMDLPVVECHLNEIVAEILAVCNAKAQQKGVKIIVSPVVPSQLIKLHRLALKIVLSSLLENAVRCSPSGSVITLEVSVFDTEIRLEVKGQGAGSPLTIVEPFSPREPGRDRQQRRGRGLYSVKRLTKALGGEVRLISTPGAGNLCTVVFKRPCPDQH